MRNIIKLIGICVVFLLPITSSAQKFDLNGPAPRDTNTITGVLPNGLTYYIRHNKEPKERASFYMIQNVGALLEKDNQNGLAHFLEHMAFNGTKHFPGKGIINTLEKHGVSFGRNVNAYTAQEETVYNISDVPTKNESLLDTCLLVLNDWSNYLLLTENEIDSERGVISEEWRTRRTAGFRLKKKKDEALYKGSMWAKRDVIGDLDIIKNFKPETIKEFYHDWYRTDLQAIAVVGDFDVVKMENKIKDLFSKIPAVKNPKPRPKFTLAANKDLIFKVATDKEAQQSTVTLYIKHKDESDNNLQSYIDSYIVSFYNSMLSSRISELLQKGIPSFLSGSSGYGGLVRGYNCYSVSATAKPNMEAEALEAVYTEAERVRRHGFLQSEFDRVKINLKSSLESFIKKIDKISNDSYCKSFKDCYMNEEVCSSSEFSYEFGLYALETITLEDVNAMAEKWIKKENRVLIVSGPNENVKHLTKDEAESVLAKVENKEITPYTDNSSGNSLISKEIKPGKVIDVKELKEFDAVEWTLSNGAKVAFRHADFNKDNVALSARSKGGTSLYEVDDLVSAESAARFIGAYGVGDFSAIELGKVLTGKKASVSPYIGDLTEGFSGGSTPKDFETMLQLLHLYFEQPRFDREAHEALMSRNYAAIKNMDTNTQKAMQDSVTRIFSHYNPRVNLMNEDYLNNVDFKKVEDIYRSRFSDASDFKFVIVGNISAEEAKPLVEKYIGSLTDIDRKETWVDRSIELPKRNVYKSLKFPMVTPKGTVIIKYSKKAKYNSYNRICQTILSKVLDLKYTENIREKEGGTYGVSVSPSVSHRPKSQLGLSISFSCDPEKTDHLKSLVYKEIEELIKNGPTDEEFSKIIVNLKKVHEQGKDSNSYWFSVLTNYYYNGENSLDPDNFENIINKLTPEDIRKAAKRFFNKSKIIDVVLS